MASIIAEIRARSKASGLTPQTITGKALRHGGRFVQWLEGAEVLPSTIDRVREWMAAHPPSEVKTRQRQSAADGSRDTA